MRRHKKKSRSLKVLLEFIKITRKNGLQRISKVFDLKQRVIPLLHGNIKFMHFCKVGSVHRLNIKRLYACEPNIDIATKYCAYQVAFINDFKPKNSYSS